MLARIVNQAHGGTIIGSWEVRDLPDDYIDACRALIIELPGIQEGVAKVEAIMAKRRKEHPQYRKYRH